MENAPREPRAFWRAVKVRLLYSFWGLLLGALCVFALWELLFLAISGRLPEYAELFILYASLAGVIAVLLAVSAVTLLRKEGVRAKNLVGVCLALVWSAGNLLCLWLAGLGWLTTLPGRFAAVLGGCVDFLLSGVLLAALVAAKHKPAYDKDFVIIPGCSISKQGGLLPLLKGRTNRAIRFAWDQEIATGKPARYIPTGGQGPDEIMSEGSAMEFYLLSHGAEQYEILPEKQSVNTYENMLFSKKIMDEAQSGAKACFVTTNYHVLRSGMLAKKAGIDAEGLASDTKWYFWPNGLAREIVAIFSLYPRELCAVSAGCVLLALLL